MLVDVCQELGLDDGEEEVLARAVGERGMRRVRRLRSGAAEARGLGLEVAHTTPIKSAMMDWINFDS